MYCDVAAGGRYRWWRHGSHDADAEMRSTRCDEQRRTQTKTIRSITWYYAPLTRHIQWKQGFRRRRCLLVQQLYSDLYCQSTCLSVDLSFSLSVCLSVCSHFQNTSPPTVLVGLISWYFNAMFSYAECLSVLTDSGSRPCCVSNDVMNFSISEISDDDISERVVRTTSCLILGGYRQQRANHIAYRFVCLFVAVARGLYSMIMSLCLPPLYTWRRYTEKLRGRTRVELCH